MTLKRLGEIKETRDAMREIASTLALRYATDVTDLLAECERLYEELSIAESELDDRENPR